MDLAELVVYGQEHALKEQEQLLLAEVVVPPVHQPPALQVLLPIHPEISTWLINRRAGKQLSRRKWK